MIDTAAKRASCIGIGLLFLRTGIIPTGGWLSSAERLHVQGLYVGITPPAPPTSGNGFRVASAREVSKWPVVGGGASRIIVSVGGPARV